MKTPAQTKIEITGKLKETFTNVEKKYFKSIRITTGDSYFVQATFWVPNTPTYSKLPKVVMTLNNSKDRIQILFPSALDLQEFTDVLCRFCASELQNINRAHVEATEDYQLFRNVLEKVTDAKAIAKAEKEFINQKTNQNEQ